MSTRTRPDAPALFDLARLEDVWGAAGPVAAATERLRTVVQQLKDERARAVGDLRRAVLNLGHECPADYRADLARILYWRYPEVPISDITAGFGFHGSASLLAVVGVMRSRATCDECGGALLATTRRELADLEKVADAGPRSYGPRPLCRRCEDQLRRAVYDEPPDDLYDNDPEAWGEDPLLS